MIFDLRHLLVYLCAALLAVAPGLAWGEIADGTATAAGAASTLISGNGQGNADIINLGAFLFPFILGAISALTTGMILRTKTARCIMRTMMPDASGKCKFYSARDDGAKAIKFTLTIFLFGIVLWFLAYDIDGRSIIAFIIGAILAITTGRKLHLKWARYLFVTLRRNLKRNQSFNIIYNKNPTTKQIFDSVSRFIPAILLIGLVFSLFVEVEILALIGSILGPFLAIIVTMMLQNEKAKQERKHNLFKTLMATRMEGFHLSDDRIRALNIIILDFNEEYVLKAWEKYADHMKDYIDSMSSKEKAIEWANKAAELHNTLLSCMAKALRYKDADIDRIEKYAYSPAKPILLQELEEQLKVKLYQVLDGEQPISIKKASDQEVADAEYALGLKHLSGKGARQDNERAEMLIKSAAEKGNAQAQYHLAGMFNKDGRSAEDKKKAFGWYQKAAYQGHAESQLFLGMMYLHGDGVEPDLIKSYAWFSLAEDSGREVSQGMADKVAGERMSEEQIAAAEAEAKILAAEINNR